MRFWAFAAVSLMAFSQPALADQYVSKDKEQDDAQIWLITSNSIKLGNGWQAVVDGNVRLAESGKKLGQTQIRGMLGYEVADGVVIGAGYSFVHKTSYDEHRVFQQASYPLTQLGSVKFTGRTRLEQRNFTEDQGLKHRLRQQVKAELPLKGVDGLKAVIHSEIYILLNAHPDDDAGFNQIRTFAGLNIPLFGTSSLEAGYMNQTELPGNNRYNHVLSLSLNNKF